MVEGKGEGFPYVRGYDSRRPPLTLTYSCGYWVLSLGSNVLFQNQKLTTLTGAKREARLALQEFFLKVLEALLASENTCRFEFDRMAGKL